MSSEVRVSLVHQPSDVAAYLESESGQNSNPFFYHYVINLLGAPFFCIVGQTALSIISCEKYTTQDAYNTTLCGGIGLFTSLCSLGYAISCLTCCPTESSEKTRTYRRGVSGAAAFASATAIWSIYIIAMAWTKC